MKHKNYYEIRAKSNYDLGTQLGEIFKKDVAKAVREKRGNKNNLKISRKAKELLNVTKRFFPKYIEELKGYAEGAGVDFSELWIITVGAELDSITEEKCTSIVTNKGMLIGATEDCFAEVQDELYLLKKSINNLTIFEIYYSYSLGGDSISINSNGVIQITNTLSHKDSQIGIPRNVIARWLSETSNPEKDFEKLRKLKRSSGYSHTLVTVNGDVDNIELSAKEQILTHTNTPFVHTNHYLSNLKEIQADNFSSGVSTGSTERYHCAMTKVKDEMTVEDMMDLLSNDSDGKKLSIFNERTIGKIVINLANLKTFVWLLRESEKGWIEYPLNFLNR